MEELVGNGAEGNLFFWIGPISAVLLAFFFKERKVRFAIPALIMTVLILNPFTKKQFEQITETGYYWRILWIVPIIPCCAALPAMLSEKIRNQYLKGAIAVAFAVVFMLAGSYTYGERLGRFFPASNPEKLPEEEVEPLRMLLEKDENPRVVSDVWVGVFARQYAPQLNMLYGRDMLGFILGPSQSARTIYHELTSENPDFQRISNVMLDEEYDYLITDDRKEERKEGILAAGFTLVGSTENYGIYQVHGHPSVRKERNELGQVIRTTFVDEKGIPVNGDAGYATVEWTYDDNGLIIREFRTDIDGIGVADSNGFAGYEREYDSQAHLLMERSINAEGKAVANSFDYAEYRRTYNGFNIISESYYDVDGRLVNRSDTGYAIIRMSYDRSNNRTGESYFNIADEPVISHAGYASVKRVYNQKKLIREAYFDTNEKPKTIAPGYSSKTRTYDNAGNMISEAYFDEAGSPVNNINGYAIIEREYDEEKNVILQRFKDTNGCLVVTGSGYAEVHRTYDGKHLIHEAYYGADGKLYTQAAGHCAIEQKWADDVLVSRTYLGAESQPVNRSDGYSKAVWETDEACCDVHFYNTDGVEADIHTLNLARDIKYGTDGWSEWLIPSYDAVNSCQNIGYLNLGPKTDGDLYTSTIEIEFKDVTATEGQTLRFWTQGAQDGKWFAGNVWNRNVINLSEAPADGIFQFSATNAISEDMVNISTFDLGFRCDYWASGMYRVRFVKIEKGDQASEWTPGI